MILSGVSRYDLRVSLEIKRDISNEKELVSLNDPIVQRLLELTATQALELAQNEPANAFAIFKELLRRPLSPPDLINVLLARAEAHFIQGTPDHLQSAKNDYEDALKEISTLITTEDLLRKKGKCLKNLAHISLLTGNVEAAKKYFQEGWETCKLDIDLLGDYIQFLQDLGDLKGALEICERAKEEHPNESKFFYSCAKIHLFFKNWLKVHQNCLACLKLDHDNRFRRAEILDLSAMSCIQLRFFEKAQYQLEEAVRLDNSLEKLIERSKIELEAALGLVPQAIFSSWMMERLWDEGIMQVGIAHSPQIALQLFDTLPDLFEDPLNLFWSLICRAATCIEGKKVDRFAFVREDLQRARGLLGFPNAFLKHSIRKNEMIVTSLLHRLDLHVNRGEEDQKSSEDKLDSGNIQEWLHPTLEKAKKILDVHPSEALVLYDQILMHPEKLRSKKLLDAWLGHACACIEAGIKDRFSEVLLNLKEALSLASSLEDKEAKATVFRCYGLIALANDQKEQALDEFKKGWKFGKPFRLLLDYGDYLARNKDLNGAKKLCKEAGISGDNEQWVYGRFFEMAHEWLEASKCYRKIIEKQSGKFKSLVAIRAKYVAIKLGDYFMANQYAFLAYQYDSPEFVIERINEHLNVKKDKVTHEHLERLSLNPRFNLAHLSSLLELYQLELEKHPKHHVHLLKRRGNIYETNGNYWKALEDFEKITKIFKSHPGIFSKKERAAIEKRIATNTDHALLGDF